MRSPLLPGMWPWRQGVADAEPVDRVAGPRRPRTGRSARARPRNRQGSQPLIIGEWDIHLTGLPQLRALRSGGTDLGESNL